MSIMPIAIVSLELMGILIFIGFIAIIVLSYNITSLNLMLHKTENDYALWSIMTDARIARLFLVRFMVALLFGIGIGFALPDITTLFLNL